MLFFIWFNLVERDCADRCLLWEEHAELMKGNDFLILHEALPLAGLLSSDILLFLICARTNLRHHVSHTFMDE